MTDSPNIENTAAYLDQLIQQGESSLFLHDNSTALVERLLQAPHLTDLIKMQTCPVSDIKSVARNYDSWVTESSKWSLVLHHIDTLHTKEKDRTEAEKEEEEEETTEEEEGLEETEDDEEGGSEKQIKELTIALIGKFTYINEIKDKLHLTLSESQTTGKPYKYSINAVDKVVTGWRKFKSGIKRLSELLGIDTVFIIWAKIMERSKFIEISTRVLGTVIIGALGAIVFIIYPIFRIIQNPIQRILSWIARHLGIKVPGTEDEE